MPRLRPWMSKAILERKMRGMTFREIGKEFEVSGQRIDQLFEPEDRAVFKAYKEEQRARDERIKQAFINYREHRKWKYKPRDRFWANVDIRDEDECWEWQLARYQKEGYEYGRLQWGGRGDHAHRVAWSLANGCEIPNGMYVCHNCDNAPCCNPKHLFLGTPKDNVQDSIEKGRWNDKGRPLALTTKQVCEIRERKKNGERYKDLAAAYSVCNTTIWKAVRGYGGYANL